MGNCREEGLISVIIPAYNAQTYIRQALESVSAQSYPHFEVIVVDDGSTDATASKVRRAMLADSRIRLVQKPNGGLADARNFGVENASGKWVTFLDSDDCLYHEALSILISAANNTGCEIVIGGISRTRNPYRSGHIRTSVMPAEKAVEMTLYQKDGMEPSACGKLYRRGILARESFCKGTWYEDLDLFYRVYLSVDRIAVTKEPVYFYRRNPDGFLSTFKHERLDVLKVTERMERYIAERIPKLLSAAKDRRMSANFNMLGLLSLQLNATDNAEVSESCLSLIRSHRNSRLLNPKVRLKNKLGVLASYCGSGVLKYMLRKAYSERPKVITFGFEDVDDACLALGAKLEHTGFIPDVIVGIKRGGAYIASEMAKLFPDAMLFEVELNRRRGTKMKQQLGKVLKFLPLFLLDRLRILESRLLNGGKSDCKCDVKLPEKLTELRDVNILVVDDAVDSGVTLRNTLESIESHIPDVKICSAAVTVTTASPIMKPDYYVYDNLTLIRFPWSIDWRE